MHAYMHVEYADEKTSERPVHVQAVEQLKRLRKNGSFEFTDQSRSSLLL